MKYLWSIKITDILRTLSFCVVQVKHFERLPNMVCFLLWSFIALFPLLDALSYLLTYEASPQREAAAAAVMYKPARSDHWTFLPFF